MASLRQSRSGEEAAGHAATEVIGESPASGPVLSVRLWRADEGAQAGPALWESPTPVVWLMVDAISASGGVPLETRGQVFHARFASIQSAVLAARRLQWAAQGVTETDNHRNLAAAVLVRAGEDATSAEPGGRYEQALEKGAQGQILLTPAASKALEDLPGFILEPASNGGLFSLAWRGPDNERTRAWDDRAMAGFTQQNGREPLPPPISSEAPASAEQSAPSGEAAAVSAQPRSKETPWTPPPSRDSASGGSGKLLVGGAVAAVLALAVFAVFQFHLLGGSKPVTPRIEPAVLHEPEQEGRTLDTQETRKTSSQSPAQKKAEGLKPAGSQKAATQAKSPEPVRITEAQKPAEEPKRPEPAPARSAAAAAPRGDCQLAPDQIPGQVGQADRSLARGNYTAARRQYESVLVCDPGNARAKEGLDRVKAAEEAEGAGQ